MKARTAEAKARAKGYIPTGTGTGWFHEYDYIAGLPVFVYQLPQHIGTGKIASLINQSATSRTPISKTPPSPRP
jgi:hypothetical protein